MAVYWGYSDYSLAVFLGKVTVYSSCVLGYSDFVFWMCSGGTVTVYSGCVLVVQ